VDGWVVKEWRRSRLWDVAEMARRLRMAASGAELAGLPAARNLKRNIWRWEAEGLRNERYELLYARALGVSPEELADGPAGAGVSSVLPGRGSQDGDDPVKRREFGFAAMGVLAGTLIGPADIPASVSDEHVRALRKASTELVARGGQVGTTALRDAISCYKTARAMVDNSRYTSPVGHDLLVVTAELAACAGFMAFDAAEQGTARSLLIESAFLATSAREPVLTARAYSLLAQQSTSLAANGGRVALAREALRFLGQAGDAARYVPSPKVHTVIAMRKATASAQLGDEPEMRKYIAAAHRELDAGDHPSDPHWLGFVSPSEVTAHEAMARLSLGQPARAADVFRAVLSDQALDPRNRAYTQALLAGALHAAGDRSQALSEGFRVLPVLEGQVRSARILNWLDPIRGAVAGDTEFAERFDAVAAA
jgi:hypothetical protein